MKKVLVFLLITIFVFTLIGCNSSEEISSDEPSSNECSYLFIAKVTEAHEGILEVEVTDKGNTSLAEGTPVHVSTRFEGYTECSVGDTVQVVFDGMIQEIYPPILPNVTSITKQ